MLRDHDLGELLHALGFRRREAARADGVEDVVDFGLLLGPGRVKLASRKGTVLILDELIDEVVSYNFV